MAKRILSEVEVDYTTALGVFLQYSNAPVLRISKPPSHFASPETTYTIAVPRKVCRSCGAKGSPKNKLKVRTEN